jgi:uncharacterized protein (DUF362 family)
MGSKTTRREFLKQAALTGAAIAGLPALAGAADGTVAGGKSRVVLATDSAVLNGEGEIVDSVVSKMLGRSVAKLCGVSTGAEAWPKLFSPDDVVAIKVNCLFGKGVSTHPEVTMAVVKGLKLAGVKEENIIIWDRSNRDLTKCGYEINENGPGARCYETKWGDTITQGVFKGRIARIISEKCTALVNVPILKTHGITGISCCLKNHYGSFDNPGSHHDNHCNPAMPDFNSIPVVRQKTRLVVVDAIRPQYEGGPGLKPDMQWNYYSLLVSKDPLAADYHGVKIIERKRTQVGMKAFDEKVTAWLQAAEDRGVGTCNPDKIDLVTA